MAAGGEPTAEERRAFSEVTLDPLDYVPSDAAFTRIDDHGGVVSFCAPSFTADGEVELGLFLNGFAQDAPTARERVAALRELANSLTDLTA